MSDLDAVDYAIVELLNEDGRMSSAEIARRIGDIPSRTVSYRIDSLIERGIIAVKALVDPAALGYVVLADVYMDVEPNRVRSIADHVASFPEVTYVACGTGESNVIMSVRVHDNEELFNFVTDQLSQIPGVRHIQTHLTPIKVKDMDNWLPPRSSSDPLNESPYSSHDYELSQDASD